MSYKLMQNIREELDKIAAFARQYGLVAENMA